jgi:hypothetical protein
MQLHGNQIRGNERKDNENQNQKLVRKRIKTDDMSGSEYYDCEKQVGVWMGMANGSKTKVYACLSPATFYFFPLANGSSKFLNCVNALLSISEFGKLYLLWCSFLMILYMQNEGPKLAMEQSL